MDTGHFDLPRYLSVLPLFQGLGAADVERLARGCHLRPLRRGDMVFHVGQPCEEFHVAVTGQVKLFALSSSGQEKVIELVGAGCSFAEELMFTNSPYLVSAQVLVDTVLLTMGKQALLFELEHDPRFALRLLAGISRRLHGLVRDVQAYALHNGLQRVIGYLLREHDTVRDRGTTFTVPLPFSMATIASRLSLTPEYFSRVLHELESSGLIEIDRREIRIHDVHRLAAYPPPG